MKKNNEKKISKASNPFILLFILIAIVYLLSFIIPSGAYDRIGKVIDPNSFHYVNKEFLSPLKVLNDLPITAYRSMGKLFITMMIVGGTISVVQDTKAMDMGIYALTKKMGDKAVFIIPLLLAFTGFLGTASVMISTVIAFIPLGITIARRLDIDNIFAVGLMFLGSYTGFMSSPISPITTALAQELSGIPPLSGFKFRLILTLILLSITAFYLTFYAYRVRHDKSKSVMDKITLDSFGELEDLSNEKFTVTHGLVLFIFFAAFVLFSYGSANWKFGVSQLASVMLPTSFLCGLVSRKSVDEICKSMIKGAQGMANPILFMLFATTITVILEGSGILDTIVYYVSIPLASLGEQMAAIGMFIANAIINLGIGSGSGQAVVVMPIMAPLADVVNVTRQTAVLAYQLGDGYTNLLNPINVMLLGSLTVAKASLKDWFKLIYPLYIAFLIVIIASLSIAVSIGWA